VYLRLSAPALAIGQYNSYIFHTSSFRFRLGYLREEVMTETDARDEGPMRAAPRRRRFYDNDYISFALPPMRTAADVVEASNAVIEACASGRLTLREATRLGSLIRRHAKLIGLVDLEKREATEDDPRIENREMIRWLMGDEKTDIRYRLADVLLSHAVLNNFDVILIDAPPRLTTASVQALCASTHVLIPTVLDPLSADDPVGYFGRQLKAHEELWPQLKVMGIVGTLTNKPQRAQEEPALKAAGDRLRAALEGRTAAFGTWRIRERASSSHMSARYAGVHPWPARRA